MSGTLNPLMVPWMAPLEPPRSPLAAPRLQVDPLQADAAVFNVEAAQQAWDALRTGTSPRNPDAPIRAIWPANNPVGTESVRRLETADPDFQSGVQWGGSFVSRPMYELAQGAISNAMGWAGATNLPPGAATTRAGNTVRVSLRGPENVLMPARPGTSKAVGQMLDEHIAEGGIPLYGGRGGNTVPWKPSSTSDDYTTVWVNPSKVDASWKAREPDFYVGPGGEGGQGTRYADFGEWLQKGEPVETPHLGLNRFGEVQFGNGRHRFAYLRDQGIDALPVTVAKEDAEQIAQKFGTDKRVSRLPGGPSDIVVTMPPGVGSAKELARRQAEAIDQAAALPGSRWWYKEGAEAFHAATGYDIDATRRVAASHAVTSPQTDVPGNSNFAVNAWNQAAAGHPIKGAKWGSQDVVLNDMLYGDRLPEARKIGPFFYNHMRYLPGEIADDLTNDIWQMRQAGFTGKKGEPYEGTPSVGEDNYVRMMVDRATRRLNDANVDGGGWTPDQVQAALWVHAKNQMQGGKGTPGGYNFANALERLMAGQGGAHRPGEALLGAARHDPQAIEAFSKNALMTDQYGRDIVNSSLGMLTLPNRPGTAAVSITADGIKPASRDLMEASTLMRATLLRQPDALWTAVPGVKGEPTIAQANLFHSASANPEHAAALRVALDRAGAGLEHSVLMQTPEGVRIFNLAERTGLTNPAFQQGVRSATKDAGLTVDLRRARADYGYYQHDWKADPTGAGYTNQLARFPGHIQRVGDQLFSDLGRRIDAAASQISGVQSGTGPWRAPGYRGVENPVELPMRPWRRGQND